MLALAMVVGAGLSLSATSPSTPATVELRKVEGRWQLYRNGEPFYVRGAGIEYGSPGKLREHGGNAFRTWTTENGRKSGQELLDEALANNLSVAMGLNLNRERYGFDYDNPIRVADQFEELKAEVLKYKDHPALLLWIVGNELDSESNPKVWDAVNDLARVIREVDPNHPTTTTLAGFDPEKIELIRTRAPELDFISFQMYSDIINLPKYLRRANWDKPYLVTEWGATGHWECGATEWGAPIENHSTAKARLYATRFNAVIQQDQTLCLGSFAFLWGNKQERTPTWYGMFLESGEKTEPVDTMQHLWTGSWPENRCPQVGVLLLDGRGAPDNIRLRPGQTCSAQVNARDPDQDPLTYRWSVMEESTSNNIGGDREDSPAHVPGLIAGGTERAVSMTAPETPGAYRLFVYIYDGQGSAAHANIPFYVEKPTDTRQAAAGQPQP
jgi:hypothetical protein